MTILGGILAVFILCTFYYAIYVLLRERKEKPTSGAHIPPMPFIQNLTDNPRSESKIKGDAFEKFVVSKFDKRFFKFKDWRSDKIHDGYYPASNTYPDLQYQYKDATCQIKFAVECKWRNDYFDNKINWATNYQIENYNSYATEHDMIVFVVIGVGGEPDSPKELFIIPLPDIGVMQTNLTKDFLKRYKKRDLNTNFYLDRETLELR